MARYFVDDELEKTKFDYCSPIFITNRIYNAPQPKDHNATITYIKFRDEEYGITCRHVLGFLKNQKVSNRHNTFAIYEGGNLFIGDDYLIPKKEDYAEKAPPDIAIIKLPDGFLKSIKKQSILIDIELPAPEQLAHALACGYPEYLQKKSVEGDYANIRIFGVALLAEKSSITDKKISLFSELEKPSTVADYSGVSGGPIFWSKEKSYGLLGIIFESMNPDMSSDESAKGILDHNHLQLEGEIITSERFANWLKNCKKYEF